ncbi:hypothetical protein JNE25001_08230 [Escherichia coli]
MVIIFDATYANIVATSMIRFFWLLVFTIKITDDIATGAIMSSFMMSSLKQARANTKI